jgi:hypothetical protein
MDRRSRFVPTRRNSGFGARLAVDHRCFRMVLQYKKVGPWKDYLFGERVYIVLSLSAKSLLCWLIWTGTLAPV